MVWVWLSPSPRSTPTLSTIQLTFFATDMLLHAFRLYKAASS
jgi:hypothetical protein